ncbi:uncharacterized protein BDCG_09410 [Blastomyces dermatitidis ER-3]|uniref:GPI anchored protein n=1 Tax=Ajellomyces dermatitidis (strain ER-3 / ATCC MYA-2586) TaxID=559297 RepID=A0ABP2ERK3_AJEDR|nr:uncharacterized protein BDCG_09410 [Blastomyces dermatitidis ER-3]EEQ86141.1 hypothetical protein BDCG_09410 [Blastomyces dermatitidis ER-3]
MPSWSRIAAFALLALSASCSALELGEVVSDFSDILVGDRDVMDNVTLADSGDLISLAKRACPARCTQYCCVSDGTCIPSTAWSCCGRGIVCGPGRKCCHNGCINDNEECCRTAGRHCRAGYECWLINGRPRCCPRGVCGSGGSGGGGGGSSRTTPAPPSPPRTRPSFDYYTWTVTWTYRVTFYTSVTIRTTTTTTTTSVVSFYASDSADASSSFRAYTATATFDPPASATDVPEPPGGGRGGSGGGNLVALPPGESGSSGIWSWHAALLAGAALVPGILAVYL